MPGKIDPGLTIPDTLLLENLLNDVARTKAAAANNDGNNDNNAKDSSNSISITSTDQELIKRLAALNNKDDEQFQPTVFTTYDEKDIHPLLNNYLVKPYSEFAQRIVRHPTDVVFLTHILLYLFTIVPSAILLFRHFTYWHAIPHTIWAVFCAGPFTLMMHNHIHNGGVLNKQFKVFDFLFPYVLEPLMGHTWDSYYYHHVKHHHVEGNGADDLSSTIRYQRDSVAHFLCYVGRFVFFVWLELPLYFLRKGKPTMALKAGLSEYVSYAFFYTMFTKVDARATVFAMLIPFGILRFFMMVGNFGQHALVDEVDPDSDFRSSITLIDVPSNRFCFNDGYHTAHHLNPRRHWRDQPLHFLQSKPQYTSGRALVFHNIDYNMMTLKILQKDYLYLADCLVPLGKDQVLMSRDEIADMLRTKTKRFTEEEIRKKWPGLKESEGFTQWGQVRWVVKRVVELIQGKGVGVAKMGHGVASVEKNK